MGYFCLEQFKFWWIESFVWTFAHNLFCRIGIHTLHMLECKNRTNALTITTQESYWHWKRIWWGTEHNFNSISFIWTFAFTCVLRKCFAIKNLNHACLKHNTSYWKCMFFSVRILKFPSTLHQQRLKTSIWNKCTTQGWLSPKHALMPFPLRCRNAVQKHYQKRIPQMHFA